MLEFGCKLCFLLVHGNSLKPFKFSTPLSTQIQSNRSSFTPSPHPGLNDSSLPGRPHYQPTHHQMRKT
jgi:hypothetical protein